MLTTSQEVTHPETALHKMPVKVEWCRVQGSNLYWFASFNFGILSKVMLQSPTVLPLYELCLCVGLSRLSSRFSYQEIPLVKTPCLSLPDLSPRCRPLGFSYIWVRTHYWYTGVWAEGETRTHDFQRLHLKALTIWATSAYIGGHPRYTSVFPECHWKEVPSPMSGTWLRHPDSNWNYQSQSLRYWPIVRYRSCVIIIPQHHL